MKIDEAIGVLKQFKEESQKHKDNYTPIGTSNLSPVLKIIQDTYRENIEALDMAIEALEQSRLIQTLKDEIDLLTMRNDPEQQKIANRQYMSKQLINEVGEVVSVGDVGIDFSTQNDFTGNVQCGPFHEKCLNDMDGT